VTNLGGGLNGTGVPFTRKKWKTDHRAKKLPTLRIGSETNTFQGLGRSWGSESFASMSKEREMKIPMSKRKKNAPMGVRSVRTFLLLVAAL
jgi:hypothetical protein